MKGLLLALAITHVTVIDTNGGAPRRDVTVVVDGERIAGVGDAPAPKGATIVDGRGKYLIPGLWDMHVHLSLATSSSLPLLIANGVTSVRDLGSKLPQIDEWRTKIGAGLITGPRILRAGPILNGKKFNEYQLVPGNADATRGVARALKEAGVDFLKVHRRMERDSYFALLDEAKKLDLRVVGHIPMTVTPEEACDAGQYTIEHVVTLFEGTFAASMKGKISDAVREFRVHDAEKLIAAFVRNHTVFDPTLVAYQTITTASDPAAAPIPWLRYAAVSARKFLAFPKASPDSLAELKADMAEYREVTRMFHRAGVPIVTGSDLAVGFTLHDELALLVESGLTPLESLQSGTIVPARTMNRDKDLGTIETGKLADLVLLDADPLADIGNTRKINAVIANGKLFRRGDVDHLLQEAEQLAARN